MSSINPLGPGVPSQAQGIQTTQKSAAAGSEVSTTPQSADAAVVAQISTPKATSLTYGATGQTNTGEQLQVLQGLVQRMFQEQGLSTEIATGDGTTAEIGELTQEEAQALIAEDGYWGAEQTSDRIADFALGMVGGDPARATEVRQSLEDGFSQARETLGSLPGISEQTIDAALTKFDEGVAELQSA